MIIDPIALADDLAKVLNDKKKNGSYSVSKQHRETVIKAEILLRKLFKR